MYKDKEWLNHYSKKIGLASVYLKTLNARGNNLIPLFK